MPDSNSCIWSGVQLSSSTDGALRNLLNCWMRYRSVHDMLSLLTQAYWFMNMLALGLMLAMVQLLQDITSFGEVASGVPFRPWMTFHMFGPSEFITVYGRRRFQLPLLALLIASGASWQASIHSCQFLCIARWRRFYVYTDFGLHVWSHPRFGFLARFCFPDVSCCIWDENIIETRYTER